VWRAWCFALSAACSFQHGELPGAGPDGAPAACATTPPWWNSAFVARFPLSVSAPANYTLTVDASAALAVGPDVRVIAHDTTATELDRVLDGSNVTFKVPASGAVFLYAGPGPSTAKANAKNIYLFAEDFEGIALGSNADGPFNPQPPNEWTVSDDSGNHVFHAAGIARLPAAVRNLMPTEIEMQARVRIGAGGGPNHIGLAARSNSMDPTTMDGFVAQLQLDIQHQRIGEYVNGASPPNELAGVTGTVSRGTWYKLRFRLVGSVLQFYIDDQLIVSAAAGAADGSLLGLFGYDCDVDFDDVRIRAATTPEPVATVGGVQRCQ
jgi:hypothetical protein